MAKRDWQIRWQDTLKEKLIRFNMSNDRKRLDKWVKDAGISIKFEKHQDYTEFNLDTNEEITKAMSLEKCPYTPKSREARLWRWRKWGSTEDYGHFMDECIKAGRKYGFRWQTIFEAMFVPRDEVEIEPFTKPQWYLEPIFNYTDKEINDRIAFKLPPGGAIRWTSEDDLLNIETYEAYNIFKVVLEFPLDYPREGTLEMAREADKAARTLCEAIGRRVKQRQKGKPTLANALKLRLNEPSLPRNEVYDIIDEINGEDLDDFPEDRKRHRQIISQRYKGKKHLTPP